MTGFSSDSFIVGLGRPESLSRREFVKAVRKVLLFSSSSARFANTLSQREHSGRAGPGMRHVAQNFASQFAQTRFQMSRRPHFQQQDLPNGPTLDLLLLKNLSLSAMCRLAASRTLRKGSLWPRYLNSLKSWHSSGRKRRVHSFSVSATGSRHCDTASLFTRGDATRRGEKPIRSERRSTIREAVRQRRSKANGEKQPEVPKRLIAFERLLMTVLLGKEHVEENMAQHPSVRVEITSVVFPSSTTSASFSQLASTLAVRTA